MVCGVLLVVNVAVVSVCGERVRLQHEQQLLQIFHHRYLLIFITRVQDDVIFILHSCFHCVSGSLNISLLARWLFPLYSSSLKRVQNLYKEKKKLCKYGGLYFVPLHLCTIDREIFAVKNFSPVA